MLGIVKRDENGELPVEELILFYHQEFVKTLKTFGFMKTPPSLLDLNVELLKHGALNVILSTCFIPFSFLDWDKVTAEDVIGTGDDTDFKRSMFRHPMCKRLLQRDMKSWVHKGWF